MLTPPDWLALEAYALVRAGAIRFVGDVVLVLTERGWMDVEDVELSPC